jgi:hypothetical protein
MSKDVVERVTLNSIRVGPSPDRRSRREVEVVDRQTFIRRWQAYVQAEREQRRIEQREDQAS